MLNAIYLTRLSIGLREQVGEYLGNHRDMVIQESKVFLGIILMLIDLNVWLLETENDYPQKTIVYFIENLDCLRIKIIKIIQIDSNQGTVSILERSEKFSEIIAIVASCFNFVHEKYTKKGITFVRHSGKMKLIIKEFGKLSFKNQARIMKNLNWRT